MSKSDCRKFVGSCLPKLYSNILFVISIVQLVPVSGQFNCAQWRKLNTYDSPTTLRNLS